MRTQNNYRGFRHALLRASAQISLATLLFVNSADIALAASRFWVGQGEAAVRNQWENTANWAATSGGAGGQSVPVAADLAIFNKQSGGVQAEIRSVVQVKGLELNSAWTGSVLQGTGTIAIGTTGMTVGSGRFIGGNAVIANSGSYTQTGGIVTGLMNTFSLSGSLSITKGADSVYSTFTNTGTLVFNGNADQNLTVGANVTKTFKNLTLNNVGAGTSDDIVTNVNGGLFLSGALVITSGNLDLTTNSVAFVTDRGITLADSSNASLTTNSAVTASGTILVNDAATLTVTAGTWTLNDDSDQTVDLDGQALFNLTINNVGGTTIDDVVLAGGPLLISGALIVTLGNLDMTTNSLALITERGITLADSAQATLTTNSNVTASGTILVNDAATLTVTAGTWTLNDDSDQTVDFDGQSLYSLTINNAGGTTIDDVVVAADSQILLSGALIITLGNLDLTTNTETLVVDRGITIADAAQATLTTNSTVFASGTILVNDAATLTVTAGTWTLNDDSDQAVDLDGQSLYNLTINNTGGGTSDDIVIAGGTLAVSNDLVVTLGNIDLVTNALALDVNDDVTIAGTAQATLAGGTMNIGGDLTLNTNGSFSQNTGTATFDGTSQTISGALVFLNFAKDTAASDTLTFSTSDSITVASSITLYGSAGSTLSIRSSVAGTQWNLQAPSTQNVAGVDVKDSRVTNSANSMVCKSRCVDSGNNLNWVLFAATTTTTTSDGSTGGTSGSGGGGRRSGGGGGGTTSTTKKTTKATTKAKVGAKAKVKAKVKTKAKATSDAKGGPEIKTKTTVKSKAVDRAAARKATVAPAKSKAAVRAAARKGKK